MAGQHPHRGRARAGAKAWAPEIDTARRPAGLFLPDGFASAADRLRGLVSQWAAAEVAPGRLMPWLPVAFGLGVVGYFAANREPASWAAVLAAIVTSVAAFLSRRRPVGFPLMFGIAAIALGFATATVQTARIAHPILASPIPSIALSGFIESREERERSDRVVVRVAHFDTPRATLPDRIRVAVRKGSAPPVGSFVQLKAHLSPPLQPLRPGGYDFARDMYFQRIGASGYALGTVKTVAPPVAGGFWLTYAATIDGMREAIDKRIRAVISGDGGSIASALITGKRDAISTPVNDAMYTSSLAHVLSISGYHMAVVAGIVFFFIRGVLALIPAVANRHPIKKWAALCAWIAAAFYLLLSGAEVATQRSFIMIAIVLIGVMLDRPTLTFRTLAVAAIAVLLLAPQAVVHPSFQMSFAATLALVAAYQNGGVTWHADGNSSFGGRVALWGVREVVGLLIASLVAGLATTPYAAYHFHRLAPYGVIANLLAMPIVSAAVMPMGILGVLAMPFGFDAAFWQLMGHGIDWMIKVALWVNGLPGAVGRIQAFGTGPLLIGTAGLLIVCLLRTPLRWSGAALVIAGGFWAVSTPRPDLLIAGDGQAAVVRGSDGRLSVLHSGRDSFAIKEWLAADADERTPKDPSLASGITCDAIGCIGKLRDGRFVSIALAIEAFAEDCSRAAVVMSLREAPSSHCTATLIDRNVWRAYGAVALRWTGDSFEQSVTHVPGNERPWSQSPTIAAGDEVRPSSPRSDAAPRSEDLDAGD